jgi:hypothetical protein
VGGLSLLIAILAVVVPRNNALFLNFSNWKQSSIVLFIFSAVFFAAAWMI